MNHVEVKVNVINQLKLLRQSTFKDKLSFLDEDIQNAQRAKATEARVSIDYYNHKVTIENNGKTLMNPQALFSIAESEWDEDVQKTESPFGMGFFSNITVSDYIEVFTGNKHIVFNVSDMIQNNKTEIEVNEVVDTYEGFKLVLNNFDFNQVSPSDIRERVTMLGKYIHELDIFCDGTLQVKKDITEGDGDIFQIKIEDDETFKGWIALNKGFSQDLKVFYKGRMVTKLENLFYIKGDLHVTDKTLNLTSPDRRDIIRDDKYNKFIESVKSYICDLASQSFLTGEQVHIESHIDSISYYADKNKMKNEMTFLIFDTEDGNDSKYLRGIALAKAKKPELNTMNKFEVYLNSEAARQSESHYEEVGIEREVKNKAPKAEGIESWSGSEGSSGGYSEPEINEDKLEERKGEKVDFVSEPVFWLGFDEIIAQESKFKIAEYYKLKIIVSRNKFESSVLELLGIEQNVVHISELTEKTKIRGTLSNTSLSKKEGRALMLLDMISRMVGFNRNVFAIGDLMVLKETSVEVLNHTIERIEDEFIAAFDNDNNKVFIDRSAINKIKLREDTNNDLDLNDYKFILSNIQEIVEMLNMMRFGDIERPENMQECIINTLAIA